MRVYVDSSAMVKRVVAEPESEALVDAVDEHVRAGDLLVASTLAWIEIARVLRGRDRRPLARVSNDLEAAMSGVAEYPLAPGVTSLARRVDPAILRSLDAIHLASALSVDADLMITYDVRLAEACEHNGLRVSRPA